MSHPSGLTCLHMPEPLDGLCPDCLEEYEADPSSWIEFGPHPEGNRRWEELQAEMAAFYKAHPQSSNPGVTDDSLPF